MTEDKPTNADALAALESLYGSACEFDPYGSKREYKTIRQALEIQENLNQSNSTPLKEAGAE
jgi:hypothetical protein